MIKALILDYGNVISLTDTKAIDEAMAAETGIPVEARTAAILIGESSTVRKCTDACCKITAMKKPLKIPDY